MYYCALSLWVLKHIPSFLASCVIWCVLEYMSRHSTHSDYVKFIFRSQCMSGGSEVNSSTNSSVYYSYMSN